MAVMTRDGWTDERLDDLNVKVDRVDERMETGFSETRNESRALRAEIKGEFTAVRGEMKEEFTAVRTEMTAEFRAIRGELGAINRSIHQLAFSLVGALLVGFLGTIAALVSLS